MTLPAVHNPFDIYLDLAGRALNGGKLYIGVQGQDPETNPQAAFWDEEGTIPAFQPISVMGGYAMRAGSPARVYTAETYSLRVRDRFNQQIYYLASVTPETIPAPYVSYTAPGGVTRSVSGKLNETLSVLDYIPTALHAAIITFTSTADLSSYFQAAVTAAAGRSLYAPKGLYNITDITIAAAMTVFGDGSGTVLKHRGTGSGNMISSTAGGQVLFRDLTIDGNEAAKPAGATIFAISCAGDGVLGGAPASAIMQRVYFADTVLGVQVAGDTLGSTLESATFEDCTWTGGREGTSPGYAPQNINASDGINLTVVRCTMNLGRAPVIGRCGIFVGAALTAFDGDNNLTIEDCDFYSLGCNVTQTLGVIDFYWRGSNVSIRNNRFSTSLTSPIRGKTNGGHAEITGNKIYAPDPSSLAGAIVINAPQEYSTRPDYLISNNVISGYAGFTSAGVISVTGLLGAEVPGVVCQNNAFIGCTGSLLHQFQYLDAPKITGGRSDGCASIVKVLAGCIGKFTMSGGNYEVVTGAYGIDMTDASITSALGADILDVNIEQTAAGIYAMFLSGGVLRVRGGELTGACTGGITSRNSTLFSVSDIFMSSAKTVGVAPTAASGGTTVDINVRNVRVAAGGNTAFVPGSFSGVVSNEGNSWNYAAAIPTNTNLPIGTKVWNTAVAAGGAPGWVRVAGAWKAMASVAA